VMSILSAYGTVNEEGAVKQIFKEADGDEQVPTFCYTELFNNHYQYWHVVDDNNNNPARMQSILMEETGKMSYWPCQVFPFILGVAGINRQGA
jgi:hypothetical protein